MGPVAKQIFRGENFSRGKVKFVIMDFVTRTLYVGVMSVCLRNVYNYKTLLTIMSLKGQVLMSTCKVPMLYWIIMKITIGCQHLMKLQYKMLSNGER